MTKTAKQLLPFSTLILIIGILTALKPDTFLTIDNFMNVLRRSSVNGIIAVGMTSIIISAGIDLSVGSMMAFSAMVGAWVMVSLSGANPPSIAVMILGTIAGIFTGFLCGLLNGSLITRLKLPPFIVTLGTMSMFRGISYIMNDGQPFNVPSYRYLGEGTIAAIPVSIIIFVAITLIAALMLKYTKFGRYTYSIGSNKDASYHCGINVNKVLLGIYAFAGLLVGIASMIAASRTISAQPTAGLSLELDIIAAVVIGGASLAGGQGTISGTIIGTLLISFLRNGCTILGISTNVQLVVIGAIIIAAVAIDNAAKSKAENKTD